MLIMTRKDPWRGRDCIWIFSTLRFCLLLKRLSSVGEDEQRSKGERSWIFRCSFVRHGMRRQFSLLAKISSIILHLSRMGAGWHGWALDKTWNRILRTSSSWTPPKWETLWAPMTTDWWGGGLSIHLPTTLKFNINLDYECDLLDAIPPILASFCCNSPMPFNIVLVGLSPRRHVWAYWLCHLIRGLFIYLGYDGGGFHWSVGGALFNWGTEMPPLINPYENKRMIV